MTLDAAQTGQPAGAAEPAAPADYLSSIFSAAPEPAQPAAGLEDASGRGEVQGAPLDPLDDGGELQSAATEGAADQTGQPAGEADDLEAADDAAADDQDPEETIEERLARLEQLERDYQHATRKITEQGQELAALRKAPAAATPPGADTQDAPDEQQTAARAQAIAALDAEFSAALIDKDGKGFTESLLPVISRRAEFVAARMIEEALAPLRAALEATVGDQYLQTQVADGVAYIAQQAGIDTSGYDTAALAVEVKRLAAEAGEAQPGVNTLLMAMLRQGQTRPAAGPSPKPGTQTPPRTPAGRFSPDPAAAPAPATPRRPAAPGGGASARQAPPQSSRPAPRPAVSTGSSIMDSL